MTQQGHDGDRIERANQTFVDRLSWTTRFDFLHYVDHRYGPDHRAMRYDDPAVVAGYVDSPNRGKFGDLNRNRRLRDNGMSARSPHRMPIPEEDLVVMQTHATLLAARRHPDAQAANERLAEATRSAAFTLQLGVREIRLLATRPWDQAHWLRPADLTALQRLVDKGLLVHEEGKNPELSEAGELLRAILVLSRHIVEPPPTTTPEPATGADPTL